MTPKLYDIPAEVERYEQILIETGGELTPELEKEFSDFIRGSKEKIEAGCLVLRNLAAQEDISKAESSRLRNRAQQFARSAEKLSGMILYAVDGMGGKIKTALLTAWGQNSANRTKVEQSPSADLAEVEKIHPQFVRTKRELNIEAILDYLESSGWKPAPFPSDCQQCKDLAEPGRIPVSEWTEHHPKCTAEADAEKYANLPAGITVRWVRGVRTLRMR